MKHQRRILLEGANNFRDLGGYPTEDGGVTRWGKLFRTDSLRYLRESDWDILRKMEVFTLVDLRGPYEQGIDPIDAPRGFAYLGMPFIYKHSLSRIAGILKAISEGLDRGGVAFFCSAGKDRTGMTSATVLKLCGVRESDIAADYMVTCNYNSEPGRGVYDRLAKAMDFSAFGGKIPEPLIQSNPETIYELLSFFSEAGLPGLLDESGFSCEAQEELKRKMVEYDE